MVHVVPGLSDLQVVPAACHDMAPCGACHDLSDLQVEVQAVAGAHGPLTPVLLDLSAPATPAGPSSPAQGRRRLCSAEPDGIFHFMRGLCMESPACAMVPKRVHEALESIISSSGSNDQRGPQPAQVAVFAVSIANRQGCGRGGGGGRGGGVCPACCSR